MSDSSAVRVSIALESAFGVTATSPVMQIVPITQQSMRDIVGYAESQTIRSDANVQENVRISLAAGGGLSIELAHSPGNEAIRTLIRSAMRSAETAATTTTGCSLVSGDTVINRTGNWSADVEVGDIVIVSGATAADDNGPRKVLSLSGSSMTVSGLDFNNSDSGITVRRGARVKNGTLQQSFTMEVARLDVQKAQIFRGTVTNTMEVNVADEAITTASFTFAAKDSLKLENNTGTPSQFIAGATYVQPTIRPVLDSIGVQTVQVAGSPYASKSIRVASSNNVAARTQVGSLGAQSMRRGRFRATGSLLAYFDTFQDVTRYAANTPVDLWYVMTDASNRGVTISLPYLKYSDASVPTQGPDQDEMKNLEFAASVSPTELCTMRLQFWD